MLLCLVGFLSLSILLVMDLYDPYVELFASPVPHYEAVSIVLRKCRFGPIAMVGFSLLKTSEFRILVRSPRVCYAV